MSRSGIAFMLLLTVMALLSGCAASAVKPWDRDLLAQKKMRFVPLPIENAVDQHVYFSKEGSTGGSDRGRRRLRVQLKTGPSAPSVLDRLRAAACVLLAAGVPAAAHADPRRRPWQLEASTLVYGEKDRAKVVEPAVRITRLFTAAPRWGPDRVRRDHGASPTGARPAGGTSDHHHALGRNADGERRCAAADVVPRQALARSTWTGVSRSERCSVPPPARTTRSRRTTSRWASARSSRSTPMHRLTHAEPSAAGTTVTPCSRWAAHRVDSAPAAS